MTHYAPEKDIDQTPVGRFVRKYGVPYELLNCMIGKTEKQTEYNLDLFEQYILDKLGVKKNKKRKLLSGYARYGYKHDSNKIIPLDNEQKVIRLIIKLYKKGLSYPKISEELFKKDIKTRQGNDRWGLCVLRTIIEREENNKTTTERKMPYI